MKKNMFLAVIATLLIMIGGTCIANASEIQSETEENNVLSTANILFNQSGLADCGVYMVKGMIDNSDVDFYQFTLPEGSEINFDIDFYTSEKNCGLSWELYTKDQLKYDPGESAYYGTTVYTNENLGYGKLQETVYLSKGTYYLKVSSDRCFDSTEYLFIVTAQGLENFQEPNEIISQAVEVKSDSLYHGLISAGKDVDFFVFTANTSGKYKLKLTNNNIGKNHPLGLKMVDDLRCDAYDANGNEVYVFDNTESGFYVDNGRKKERETYLSAGQTFFKISAGSNSYQGDYTLQIVPSVNENTDKADNAEIKNPNVSDSNNSGNQTEEPPYSNDETINAEEESWALSKLSIIAKTTAKKGAITVTWSVKRKTSSVDGYEIWRSKKYSSRYYKIYTTTKKSYKDNRGLKKGTRYYYKVRAYKIVDGQKITSNWSNRARRIAK